MVGGKAKPLAGSQFWRDWGEDDLGSVYDVVRKSMPRGSPGSLTEQMYLDIVAHILHANGFPAGADELTASRVDGIRITGKDGPGPVPNFSLVAVVGCLSQRDGKVWMITSSSEPIRTRNPAASTDSERRRLETTPLGDQTFELMDTYGEPTAHNGYRVEVKGLLIRGSPSKLNVTGLQPLAPTCAS